MSATAFISIEVVGNSTKTQTQTVNSQWNGINRKSQSVLFRVNMRKSSKRTLYNSTLSLQRHFCPFKGTCNCKDTLSLQRYFVIAKILYPYKGTLSLKRYFVLTRVLCPYKGSLSLQSNFVRTKLLCPYKGTLFLQLFFVLTVVLCPYNVMSSFKARESLQPPYRHCMNVCHPFLLFTY